MVRRVRRIPKEIVEAVEHTRNSYEQVAAVYDTFSAPFQIAVTYPKIISAVRSFFDSLSGKEILDVGCGAGTLIQMFNEQGAKCSGIDVASVFVELAHSRGLDVTEASMHDLPLPDESFDAVVSNYALNYLPAEGQQLTLQEKFRVLRPGGIMIFSYMHPFFMRANRRQPALTYHPVDDYFRPKEQEVIDFFGQKFTLYLSDWPEIVNMVLRCGFHLREFIDAEIPNNLEQIACSIEDEVSAQYVRSFRYNPYGIFVVATK